MSSPPDGAAPALPGADRASAAGGAAAEQVAWHDLECGAYRTDLPLWRELAAAAGGPVLDVGAGTGRVALDLARRGHTVIAVDSDPVLVRELERRAAGLPIRCVVADARRLSLPESDLALCVVPMQTLQLLGGAEGRAAFLVAAREHLRGGALLACAIVEAMEPFDSARQPGLAPTPDRARIGDSLYVSQPTALRVRRSTWLLERDRVISGPAGTRREHDVIELDRVSARQLAREGRAAGLRSEPPRTIPESVEHVGSTVVMLRA